LIEKLGLSLSTIFMGRPAVNTDPADDFELDRELGIVPQYDIMEPRTSAPAPTPAPAPAPATSIRDVGNVTSVTEPLDIYYPFDESVFELIDTPPRVDAIAAPAPKDTAPQDLTQRDLDEMALFQMMSEQLLTGNDYWDQLLRDDPYFQER